MMYQACSSPGKKPRQQSAILMRESALHMPRLTQTPMGGKRMESRQRKQSVPHILKVIRGVERFDKEFARVWEAGVS